MPREKVIHILTKKEKKNQKKKEIITIINQLFSGRDTFFNAGWLASGVYYYRIQSGSFTETKKMMLLK